MSQIREYQEAMIDALRRVHAAELDEARCWIAAGTGQTKDWPWLEGSMQRFESKRAGGGFDGPHGEASLVRFIGQEAVDLFDGFDDDTPENRASYAASLWAKIHDTRTTPKD